MSSPTVTCVLLILWLAIDTGHRVLAQNETATAADNATASEPEEQSASSPPQAECKALPAIIAEDVDTLQQIIAIAMDPDKKVRAGLEKKFGLREDSEDDGQNGQAAGKKGAAEVISEDKIKTLPRSGKGCTR